MEARTKEYMLLPNLSFLPGKEIQLGVLLPLNETTKLPDPESPLNANNLPPLDAPPVEPIEEKDFKFGEQKSTGHSNGVFANISMLTGLGAGFQHEKGQTSKIEIQCETLITERFRPSQQYIQQCLDDMLIDQYLKTFPRPSVYLVMGLKIASKVRTKFEHQRSQEGRVELSADATSIGVPIHIGPHHSLQDDQQGNIEVSQDSVILAYRLLRITKKAFGKELKKREYNEWALLDDDKNVHDTESEFDLEIVSTDTTHSY